ncbi:hypothetical protein [Wolbachia endosymbiont (group A) of Scambus nigricans]|nr:hypothetical protein [Wolbachia endosymbiont (group A) of Scambus nigricans]
MLLACYSHKHISYRIRTIIRKAIQLALSIRDKFYLQIRECVIKLKEG